MSKIIAITNQKGGVGKTTTSINLAACVADAGKKSLVIDADPQGNTTSGLGIHLSKDAPTLYEFIAGQVRLQEVISSTPVKNLSLIPSDIRLAGAEIELAGDAEPRAGTAGKPADCPGSIRFCLYRLPAFPWFNHGQYALRSRQRSHPNPM